MKIAVTATGAAPDAPVAPHTLHRLHIRDAKREKSQGKPRLVSGHIKHNANGYDPYHRPC